MHLSPPRKKQPRKCWDGVLNPRLPGPVAPDFGLDALVSIVTKLSVVACKSILWDRNTRLLFHDPLQREPSAIHAFLSEPLKRAWSPHGDRGRVSEATPLAPGSSSFPGAWSLCGLAGLGHLQGGQLVVPERFLPSRGVHKARACPAQARTPPACPRARQTGWQALARLYEQVSASQTGTGGAGAQQDSIPRPPVLPLCPAVPRVGAMSREVASGSRWGEAENRPVLPLGVT